MAVVSDPATRKVAASSRISRSLSPRPWPTWCGGVRPTAASAPTSARRRPAGCCCRCCRPAPGGPPSCPAPASKTRWPTWPSRRSLAVAFSRGGEPEPLEVGLDGGQRGQASDDEGGGQGAQHPAEYVKWVVVAEIDPADGDRDRVQTAKQEGGSPPGDGRGHDDQRHGQDGGGGGVTAGE